jgi:hypothetical protein
MIRRNYCTLSINLGVHCERIFGFFALLALVIEKAMALFVPDHAFQVNLGFALHYIIMNQINRINRHLGTLQGV